MRTLLIAIDGGGSSTRLWVLNGEGELVAEGRGGPSTVTVVGAAKAGQSVADAGKAAGLSLETEQAVTAGAAVVAGVEREPEYSRFLGELERLFPGADIVLKHDATGALLAGTMGEPGVLILSGTGSVSISMGPDGEIARAGGWGHVLGDEGSGYWIGREALRRAIRAADGRDRSTILQERLAQVAGVNDVLGVIGPVMRGEFDRPWIARLAPVVAQAAAEGDAVAEAIMDEAAHELAVHVRAVLSRSPWFDEAEEVPVVAAGGIFGLGEDWYGRLQGALRREAPRARLTDWVKEPIVGAVYLAFKQYYGDIPADVRQRLLALRARHVVPIA